MLDYDDLLLYWHALLLRRSPNGRADAAVRRLFDCVLVDEYQDTNTLQAEILYALSPEGKGLTVVGDDAQSIYAFRAATVRNILDFPKHYPDATIVTLEQNYRSTQPILEATNRVIGLARERYHQEPLVRAGRGRAAACWSTARTRPTRPNTSSAGFWSTARRASICGGRPCCSARRTTACCWKPSWPARNIPFHKYGGLKFVETAHVKDLMAFLRLAENPRDVVAGTRLLPLLPGIGPGKARQLMDMLLASGRRFRRLGRVEAARRRGEALAASSSRCSSGLAAHGRRPAGAGQPRAEVLHAAVGGEVRPRRAAAPRPGATGTDRLALPQPAADAAGDDARSAQFDAGPGRPAGAGRRLPGAEHDPFGQGAGVGRGLRDPRRRRQHPLRHGHEEPGGDRGGAAAVLRGPDAGEELALRLLSAALLLARPQRPSPFRPADAVLARQGADVLSSSASPIRSSEDDGDEFDDAPSRITSRSVRRRTKDLWG